MKLYAATSSVLFRLDDEANDIWSRAEIDLYVKDGYDKFARQTKCIWDFTVIPNVPPVGNYGSDLQRFLAEQKPGMALTDRPINRSGGETERNLSGGSLAPATAATSPGDAAAGYFDDFSLPTTMSTGRLPDGTVDVLRVAWDQITLTPSSSVELARFDPNYEITGGDPRYWAWDKDGINAIRFYPVPGGDAEYDTIDGSRGALKYTDDTAITASGIRGILRQRTDAFPAGGQRGTPRVIHPDTRNIRIEIARLGRPLETFDMELPRTYEKYPIFWAMAMALERDGPGQDPKMAKHYKDRFAMGAQRMTKRLHRIIKERVGKIGNGPPGQRSLGLGMAQLPYNYGPSRPFRGGY